MRSKLFIVIVFSFIGILPVMSQFGTFNPNSFGAQNFYPEQLQDTLDNSNKSDKKHVPSIIKTWQMLDHGSLEKKTELDTSLNFYHIYDPIFMRSISNTFTGKYGGAYLSNDFFSRTSASDFYFYRSFDAYAVFPDSIKYYNTTTPYTLLDYVQSENKNNRAETKFNVLFSYNVNPKLNFNVFYNSARSMGHYQKQDGKFNTFGFNLSYMSDKFNSFTNFLFNNYQTQENGGLDPADQDLNAYEETINYLVNLQNANSKIKNNTFRFTNEYKVGKTEEIEGEDGYLYDSFRPITGFIHQFEFSGNNRYYSDSNTGSFFQNHYLNSQSTGDTIKYNRITNIFQIKFYEAPERKFTFTQRAFIGYDILSYSMPSTENYWMTINNNPLDIHIPVNNPFDFPTERYKRDDHNLFVGGGLSRTEGNFWKWSGQAKIYLTGIRAGQTEINAYIDKPLRIGKDTTSLRIEGELNTIVPDFFESHYNSNHFTWNNSFGNTQEMIIRGKIHSQNINLTAGMNYALINNYIYNDSLAIPRQGAEMLVLGAYINKDIVTKHWLFKAQVLWQQTTEERYLHLPAFTGFLSVNYRFIISKVLHTHIGFDARYNTKFYADAFEPATGRFYWQDKKEIGNYPFLDAHINLKLKRTRAFFLVKNIGAGWIPGEYWTSPDYPLHRRVRGMGVVFRLGIAWSFYD